MPGAKSVPRSTPTLSTIESQKAAADAEGEPKQITMIILRESLSGTAAARPVCVSPLSAKAKDCVTAQSLYCHLRALMLPVAPIFFSEVERASVALRYSDAIRITQYVFTSEL